MGKNIEYLEERYTFNDFSKKDIKEIAEYKWVAKILSKKERQELIDMQMPSTDPKDFHIGEKIPKKWGVFKIGQFFKTGDIEDNMAKEDCLYVKVKERTIWYQKKGSKLCNKDNNNYLLLAADEHIQTEEYMFLLGIISAVASFVWEKAYINDEYVSNISKNIILEQPIHMPLTDTLDINWEFIKKDIESRKDTINTILKENNGWWDVLA